MSETTEQPAVLEYDVPRLPKGELTSKRLAWSPIVARVCAFAPMLVGILITMLWVLTPHDILKLLGFFTIFGGGVATVAGMGALLDYAIALKRIDTPARLIFRRIALLGLPMLANFPLAVACGKVVEAFPPPFSLMLTNNSSLPVAGVVITTPDEVIPLAPINPGASIGKRMRISRDGVVSVSVGGSVIFSDRYAKPKISSKTSIPTQTVIVGSTAPQTGKQ